MSQAQQDALALLSGPFKKSSKNRSCQALGDKLGLHHKTVWMISNGGYCGEATAAKLRRLVANPTAARDWRNHTPRLYVYYPDRETIEFVREHTTPQERRDALLALAQAGAE